MKGNCDGLLTVFQSLHIGARQKQIWFQFKPLTVNAKDTSTNRRTQYLYTYL